MQVHASILVKGMVQGVGYRFHAYREAKSLGLVGYVKNVPDGSVASEVEGDRGLIEDYIKSLRIGPAWSSVTSVQVEWSKFTGNYKSFDVTY